MDINTVITDITTALNDAYAVAGQPSLAQQLADAQAANQQLTTDKAALQAKIDAAKVAAQADKDADAANVAGQGVLDALA